MTELLKQGNSHDYGRKENGYEYWTVLKEARDWSELER